ncbi:MAG: hypothetical protein AB8B71_03575 [Paracoccaceae bacterium]
MSTRPSPGPWFAAPVALFMIVCFAAPIVIVTWYSFMPSRTFDLTGDLTLENYRSALTDGYGRPLMWSLIGATTTTIVTASLA